jgi:hypothetical protein
MARNVRVVVDHQGDLRNFVSVSFQDHGSISVAFSDRSFLIPGFVEELDLDDVVHRSQVDLEAAHGLEAITNPHFTFHPPGYVHLRANGQDELFAGLLMIDLMVEQEGHFPWIRFISNPVETLTVFQGARGARNPSSFGCWHHQASARLNWLWTSCTRT